MTELTPELVHEFIERIVVSKPEKISGKRHQTIDIYYHGAGIIKMLSAEERKKHTNNIFQNTIKQKRHSRSYTVQITIIKFYCKSRLGVTSLWRVPQAGGSYFLLVKKINSRFVWLCHKVIKSRVGNYIIV